jgi:hypothetical protein
MYVIRPAGLVADGQSDKGPRHGLEMKHGSELEPEARRKRSTADRARRLARLASSPQDQVQMEQLAKDLDRQAAELEAEAVALRTSVRAPDNFEDKQD